MIRRDRVLAVLDQAAEARVICLRAPAGFGKTTALVHRVDRDPRPTLWLTVRPQATDAQWLAQALVDALAEAELVADEVVLSGSLSMASWNLDTLPVVEDLVSRAARPFLVVVDDAGAMNGMPWECLVESIASALPPGAQLVLTTKECVLATLWRLQSRDQVSLIDPEILAFDADETKRVMESLHSGVSAEQLRELTRSTGGWPVAVSLAGISMRSTPGATLPTTWVGNSGLRQYLLAEVVGRLAQADAEFLARISVLALVDGTACDEVAGTTHSLQRLRRLASDDHLLTPPGPGSRAFHDATAAGRAIRSSGGRPTRRRAGPWNIEGISTVPCITHSWPGMTGDWRFWIWSQTASLLGSGQYAVLQRWLDGVGEQRLADRCGLALSSAWVASHEGDIPRMSRLALAAGAEHKALSLIRESRELAVRYRIHTITTTAPIFTTSAVGYVREGRFADARHEAARAPADSRHACGRAVARGAGPPGAGSGEPRSRRS